HDALGGVPGDGGVAGGVDADPLVAADAAHGAAQDRLHADGPGPAAAGAGAGQDGDGVGEAARLGGAVVEVQQVGEHLLVLVLLLHGTQVREHAGGQRLHPACRVGGGGHGGGPGAVGVAQLLREPGVLLAEPAGLLLGAGPQLGQPDPFLVVIAGQPGGVGGVFLGDETQLLGVLTGEPFELGGVGLGEVRLLLGVLEGRLGALGGVLLGEAFAFGGQGLGEVGPFLVQLDGQPGTLAVEFTGEPFVLAAGVLGDPGAFLEQPADVLGDGLQASARRACRQDG